MDAATRYDLVRDLHIGADIVFIAGLLAGALVLAALSFQAASRLQKERRLARAMLRVNRFITGGALTLAWGCGLWLAWRAGWFASSWLHVKLVIVLVLSGLHGAVSAALRRAGADAPRTPSRAWRIAPAATLAAVAVVVWLALGKPF